MKAFEYRRKTKKETVNIHEEFRVSIPRSEAWVYKNPEVIGKVRKGLQEAREGKGERVDNLDSFLKKI